MDPTLDELPRMGASAAARCILEIAEIARDSIEREIERAARQDGRFVRIAAERVAYALAYNLADGSKRFEELLRRRIPDAEDAVWLSRVLDALNREMSGGTPQEPRTTLLCELAWSVACELRIDPTVALQESPPAFRMPQKVDLAQFKGLDV